MLSRFVLFFLFVVACVVDGIIPGLLLPHGDFAFDPTLAPPGAPFRAAADIASASRAAANDFLNHANYSHILLVTPHGLQLDHDFGLYIGKSASGNATIGMDLIPPRPMYELSVQNLAMDMEASLNLLDYLQIEFQNVSGIYSYSEASDLPLNWGEIIPLRIFMDVNDQLMEHKQAMATTSIQKKPKFIILSLPHRRYKHDVNMIPELLALGSKIGQWMLSAKKQSNGKGSPTFGVIVSGDLSHTHQSTGPYGYSNESRTFDCAVGKWAMDPCQFESYLIHRAKLLQPHALSCGFSGYALWQGILRSTSCKHPLTAHRVKGRMYQERVQGHMTNVGDNVSITLEESRIQWRQKRQLRQRQLTTDHSHDTNTIPLTYNAEVYANRNVTYYGMIAASFLPNENDTFDFNEFSQE